MKKEKLKFAPAIIYKIQTTPDGGIRVAFEIDASQTEAVAALLLLRQREDPVRLTVEKYGGK